MIVARGISKGYRSGPRTIWALPPTTLDIQPGEFAMVLGRSGSGKSTLLGTLGGLLRPSTGQVLLDGQPLWELRERERAHLRAHKIGFVFQNATVIPSITLLENVLLPTLFLQTSTKPTRPTRQRAMALLDQVGLKDRAHAYPSEISGGEQRRVALASALMNKPALLLADEPTGELDPETEADIMALLEETHRQGTTLLIVTHNPQLTGAADRVLTLSESGLREG